MSQPSEDIQAQEQHSGKHAARIQEIKQCMAMLKKQGAEKYARHLKDRAARMDAEWKPIRERERRRFERWQQQLEIACESGRNECIALCAAMHAALPRELRDQIYDLLLDLPGHYTVNPSDEVLHGDSGNVRRKFKAQVWRQKGYVGDLVAEEIAERWYSMQTFQIQDVNTGCTLHKFLMTDDCNPTGSFIPAMSVRNLALTISPHDFSVDPRHPIPGRKVVQSNLPEIEQNLELLSENVKIILWFDATRVFDFEALVTHTIRPILAQIQHQRVKSIKASLGLLCACFNQEVCEKYRQMNPYEKVYTGTQFDTDTFCNKVTLLRHEDTCEWAQRLLSLKREVAEFFP